MAAYLIEMFGVSLALTVVSEWAVILLFGRFGLRSGKGMLLSGLVNLLTNPPVVLIHWLFRLYLPEIPSLSVQICLELAVIAGEALIYRWFAGEESWPIRRPVLLSVTANTVSWTFGLALSQLI